MTDRRQVCAIPGECSYIYLEIAFKQIVPEVCYIGKSLFMIILNKASDVIIVDYPRLDWEKSLLKINRNFSILVLILSLNNLNFTQLFSQTMNKQNNNSTEVATFGAGCFWCAEAVFSRVEGVNDVQSGYSGGHVKNPSYKEVCTGNTGHAEVCQITYDSSKVSFLELLEIFWGTHNPTTLNRQGNDVGTQYRSVIFYYSPEQKKLATDMISRLDKESLTTKYSVSRKHIFNRSFHES